MQCRRCRILLALLILFQINLCFIYSCSCTVFYVQLMCIDLKSCKLQICMKFCEVYIVILSFILQTLLAKALYDNAAETPDELAFRRGDVLEVLEQDANGLEGWWLCAFRGKQGIAPGNRLKLLSGMTENGHPENLYQTPPSGIKHWHRRSWDVSSNQVKQRSVV